MIGAARYARFSLNDKGVDVFDAEGRFLGEVEAPAGTFESRFSWSRIDGDRVVVAFGALATLLLTWIMVQLGYYC